MHPKGTLSLRSGAPEWRGGKEEREKGRKLESAECLAAFLDPAMDHFFCCHAA